MFMPETGFLALIGVIGGFILAMVIIFSGSTSPVMICSYSLCQGLFLGGVTWAYEQYFPGIGILAVVLTLGILGAMLTIYRAGLISWSKNLQIAVMSALTAILMIYLISFIGVFLGFEVPHSEASPIGILFSVFVICIFHCNRSRLRLIERRGPPNTE